MRARSLQLLVFAAVLAFAVPGPATAKNGEEDPCRTREPTVLDRLPEWRCVGLATFGDDIGDVEEEPRATDDRTTQGPGTSGASPCRPTGGCTARWVRSPRLPCASRDRSTRMGQRWIRREGRTATGCRRSPFSTFSAATTA
jgi:hypothetical protein